MQSVPWLNTAPSSGDAPSLKREGREPAARVDAARGEGAPAPGLWSCPVGLTRGASNAPPARFRAGGVEGTSRLHNLTRVLHRHAPLGGRTRGEAFAHPTCSVPGKSVVLNHGAAADE